MPKTSPKLPVLNEVIEEIEELKRDLEELLPKLNAGISCESKNVDKSRKIDPNDHAK